MDGRASGALPGGPGAAPDAERRGMRSLLASLMFGFVAGTCDGCGLVALHQLFMANITGDLVLLGADWAAHDSHQKLGRLLALPVFIAVVWAARLLAGWLDGRGLAARRSLLLIMLVLLAAFAALGLMGGPFPTQDAPNTLTIGLVGVTAMGFLNVVARLWPALADGSTAMTGNTVKLLADIAELMVGERPNEPKLLHDSGRLALSVATFTAGCALAALVWVEAGMWCTALPLAFGVCMVPLAPGHGSNNSQEREADEKDNSSKGSG